MPLTQMDDFTFKHSDQLDAIYTQYTANQIKSLFDSRGVELRTALNLLIAALSSTNGANDIGTSTIQDLDGTNVQAMLQSIRDKLKSKTDSSSGADYVNVTAINGLVGETVQTILEALKKYVDDYNANHKLETSTDHDNRYYSKTELQSMTQGSSGGSKISVPQLSQASGTTVESQLAYLLTQIGNAALGQIPDASLTLSKMATDVINRINMSLNQIGAIIDADGNISNLNTIDKTKLVNAINEILSGFNEHKADTTAHGMNNKMDKTGGPFTGIVTAQSNTSYTTRQIHNIILSQQDADVNSMQDGDIWIKYV